MLIPANSEFAPPADNRDEIAIGDLLDRLAEHSEAALVFYYDGRPVKPGYHVTEVKAGQFAALDCGANAEAWTEIFIQLWDVEEGQRSHMKAGKFAAIIRKVAEHVSLENSAKLTFEVSDGERPMQLYRASAPQISDGQIRVDLSPRPASCKPRDRWLEEQARAKESACCGSAEAQPCCS